MNFSKKIEIMDTLYLDAYRVEITTSFVRPPLLTLAIGHIVVVYLSRLFHRFWRLADFTLHFSSLFSTNPDPTDAKMTFWRQAGLKLVNYDFKLTS